MNECLLCEQTIASTPSWKALIGTRKTNRNLPRLFKKVQTCRHNRKRTLFSTDHIALYIQRSDAGIPASIQISARRRTCSRLRE